MPFYAGPGVAARRFHSFDGTLTCRHADGVDQLPIKSGMFSPAGLPAQVLQSGELQMLNGPFSSDLAKPIKPNELSDILERWTRVEG